MTTTNEPLSGVDLAAAVAEAFGWRTNTYSVKGALFIERGNGLELWEPWRDMNTCFEIVDELLKDDLVTFELVSPCSAEGWGAAFHILDLSAPKGRHSPERYSNKSRNEAIQLAALAAKEILVRVRAREEDNDAR